MQKSVENWPVCSKVALGEVGMSLPWWCHTFVLLAPGYWEYFINLIILFKIEKGPVSDWISYGKIAEI